MMQSLRDNARSHCRRSHPTGDIKLTWLHEYTRFENYQHPEYDEFSNFGGDGF
jgi:hypothetical protein